VPADALDAQHQAVPVERERQHADGVLQRPAPGQPGQERDGVGVLVGQVQQVLARDVPEAVGRGCPVVLDLDLPRAVGVLEDNLDDIQPQADAVRVRAAERLRRQPPSDSRDRTRSRAGTAEGCVSSTTAVRSPPYLDVRVPELTATFVREPRRAEVPVICNEQLVVEYYSR